MKLPTAKEINPCDENLDGRVACKMFLGRSLDEAEALFRENSCYYQEGLMWMGPVAFRFYVTAAIWYIKSAAAAGDSNRGHAPEQWPVRSTPPILHSPVLPVRFPLSLSYRFCLFNGWSSLRRSESRRFK